MAKLRAVIKGDKGYASRLSNHCITAKVGSYNFEVNFQMLVDKNNNEKLFVDIKDLATGKIQELFNGNLQCIYHDIILL